MTKRLVMGGAVGVFVAASVYVGAAGPQEPPGTTAPIASHPQGALLAQYCVGCHNQRAKVGNFTLDQLDLSKVGEEAETWEKVVLKLNAGLMPPPGNRRPSPEAHRAFLTWLESELDTAARLRPNAGRPETFHRLNRFEYGNAVRDLLDLEVDVETLLPTDDAGYGFDNIAGVLKLSQSLMERYMSAARKISRRAVGSVAPPMVLDTFRVSSERRQYERVEGLPFGTRGGLLIPYYFPRDGEYSIRATFICNFSQGGFCDGTNSYEDSHQLEVTIDGERVHLFDLEKRPARRYEDSHSTADGTEWEVRVPVKAGEREVGVTFLKLPFYETSTFGRLPFQGPAYEGNMVPAGLGVYQPYLEAVTIGGPYEPTGGPGDTASWRRIFTCWPASAAEDAACAKAILSQLARRAYRRPVTEKDVQALLVFYEEVREAGGPFELGVETGLRALLVSPSVRVPGGTGPESGPGRGAGRGLDGGGAGRGGRGGHELPAQRPGSGLAAVVLPVEQHSGRGAARGGGAGAVVGSGDARGSRCGGCWPTRARRRCRRTSCRSGCRFAGWSSWRRRIRISTRRCGTRCGRKRSCSSTASSATIGRCRRC